MLTKQDLQLIGEVITKKLEPVERQVSGLDEKVTKLEKGQIALKRVVNKLAKDQSVMLRVLNNENVETRKRVDRIEEHLGLAS